MKDNKSQIDARTENVKCSHHGGYVSKNEYAATFQRMCN